MVSLCTMRDMEVRKINQAGWSKHLRDSIKKEEKQLAWKIFRKPAPPYYSESMISCVAVCVCLVLTSRWEVVKNTVPPTEQRVSHSAWQIGKGQASAGWGEVFWYNRVLEPQRAGRFVFVH